MHLPELRRPALPPQGRNYSNSCAADRKPISHVPGLICRMAHSSQIHCVPGLISCCLFQYFPGNCSLRIKAPAYCKRALHKDSGMGAWEKH